MKHLLNYKLFESSSGFDEWYERNMQLCDLGLQPRAAYLIVREYIQGGSKGSLDLDSTRLTDLPNNLTVDGVLYIGYTNVSELPVGLTVKGLNALYSKLKSLPDNYTFSGNVDIEGCPITELPDNLTVNKLDIRSTGINDIPGTLDVDVLFVSGTPLAQRFNHNPDKIMEYVKSTGARVRSIICHGTTVSTPVN
jgi:hypothetical protein